MITCKALIERATDYMEDACSAADRHGVEEHLAVCPVCPSYLRQLKETAAAMRLIDAEPLTPEVEARILEGLQRAAKK